MVLVLGSKSPVLVESLESSILAMDWRFLVCLPGLKQEPV